MQPDDEILDVDYDPLLPIRRSFHEALDSQNREQFKALVLENRERLREIRLLGESLLSNVARTDDVELVSFLLDLGIPIHPPEEAESPGPLMGAIHEGAIHAARYLLQHGADPNHDRTLIAAINSEKHSLELVKLLVEHGADIHRCFRFGSKNGPVFNALSWAIANGKQEIADYLRSKGAVMPDQKPLADKPKNLTDEVVAYFDEHFGPVHPKAVIEIVPSGPPISIHIIPANGKRKHITLFTTGMSAEAMKAPPGQEDYGHAELFMQLPESWKYAVLDDPNHAWPIHWLRSMAKYPHVNETWLGGPATIVANDEPPQPLAPNCPFTCMLLMAESEFASQDGRTIQLYRLSPLYTEERELEISEGLPALLRAMDQFNIPFIVDLNRPNVAHLLQGRKT